MKQIVNYNTIFTASTFCKTIAFICLFALPLVAFSQKYKRNDLIGHWQFYDFVLVNPQFDLICDDCDSIKRTELLKALKTEFVEVEKLAIDSIRRAFMLSYFSFDKNGNFNSCIQGKMNSSTYRIRRKSGIIFKNDIATTQMRTIKKGKKTHRFIVISSNYPHGVEKSDADAEYLTTFKAEFWFSISDDNLKRDIDKDTIDITTL